MYPKPFFPQESPGLSLLSEAIVADESSITEPAPQPHEDSFHLEFEIVDDSTKSKLVNREANLVT